MEEHLRNWIDHLSKPQENLGGFSICPYAKGAEYQLINSDSSDIDPPPWNFELIIYKLPDDYTSEEIDAIAKEYNKIYPDLVFLPDPKNYYTEINGVQTNNGRYNLILCQYRDNLKKVREKLKNSDYYTFWSPDYLDKILSS